MKRVNQVPNLGILTVQRTKTKSFPKFFEDY